MNAESIDMLVSELVATFGEATEGIARKLVNAMHEIMKKSGEDVGLLRGEAFALLAYICERQPVAPA